VRAARSLPLVALVLVLAGCGGKHRTATPEVDSAGCVPLHAPSSSTRTAPKPKAALDATKTYDVRFRTNCGSFTIRLAVRTSPATAASFASLVRRGFLDRTAFHRIVPGFVIQGGDPTASGRGGPGYTVDDPPPASTRYTLGVAAMAKTPAEPAGTSGSQFFVVTAADARLTPDYAVLGRVVSGLAVVKRIGRLGDPATEEPTETVEIQKATLVVH
jgi:peptidyl-prolyl cis-trans isomerase B (cyclophilin B)